MTKINKRKIINKVPETIKLVSEKHTVKVPETNFDRLPVKLVSLLKDLEYTISHRRYDETERIANDLLDLSPSEEVDRCIHDIITSATVITDAEDEINYQFSDLETALQNTTDEELTTINESDIDGL
ncbi:MAG: hypothetical protein IPK14_22720 [Blastocatellia bacterium]|nr:hypothetical protein [Blastocatellia bacterium]MBN8723100.1 hypothetical protein [Acidobacteriota bacterium]